MRIGGWWARSIAPTSSAGWSSTQADSRRADGRGHLRQIALRFYLAGNDAAEEAVAHDQRADDGPALRNESISSKNRKRCFSKSTKWVAWGRVRCLFSGALVRSRIRPSRSRRKLQVSSSPAITSVGT